MSIFVVEKSRRAFVKCGRSVSNRTPFPWNPDTDGRGTEDNAIPTCELATSDRLRISGWANGVMLAPAWLNGAVCTFPDRFASGTGPPTWTDFDGTFPDRHGNCVWYPAGDDGGVREYRIGDGNSIRMKLRKDLQRQYFGIFFDGTQSVLPYDFWRCNLGFDSANVGDGEDMIVAFIKRYGLEVGTYVYEPLLSTGDQTDPGCYIPPLATLTIESY